MTFLLYDSVYFAEFDVSHFSLLHLLGHCHNPRFLSTIQLDLVVS